MSKYKPSFGIKQNDKTENNDINFGKGEIWLVAKPYSYESNMYELCGINDEFVKNGKKNCLTTLL